MLNIKRKGIPGVIVFLIIIISFIVIVVWYLIANDFASETLNVLYPAFGGILATIYLGYKSIYLDAPKSKTFSIKPSIFLKIFYPTIGAFLVTLYLGFKSIYVDAPKPKTFDVMTVIFHDYDKGQIKSLVPLGELKYVTRFNMMTDFLGSHLFDVLQNDSAFKNLNISAILQNSPITGDSDVSNIMIGHFIEYAILQWMCYNEMRADYTLHYQSEGIINTLGSGSASIGRDLIETPMVLSENELNPLMKAKPLKMYLPKGSKIVRFIDGLPLKFEINTRHSRLQIICGFSEFDQLGIPFHEEAKQFYQILGWPTNIQDQGICAWGIDIDFTVSQKPFRRFSRQAKLEAQWLNRLPEQLEKGFSWAKLEKIYMQD